MTESVVATRRKAPVYSALKHANYRWYWIGALVYVTGFQIQTVAQGWLVLELTNSPFYLGLVGLFTSVPTIGLSLFGGVLADRVDRRKLLIGTQSTSMVLIFILATLIAFNLVAVWHVLLIAAAQGAVLAFDQPSRQALIPSLVPKEDLMNAIALGSTVWNGARIIGPSIGGVVISLIGVAGCYYITAFSFLAMIGSLLAINIPPQEHKTKSTSMLRNMAEGLSYIRTEPVFFTLIGMTFFNSIFGMAYVALMPIFARDILSAGATGLGFLMGVSGIGALLGTLTIAALGDFRRKGVLLLAASTAFGLLIAAFGYSQWLWVSAALMVVAGLTNAMYMTSVNTLLQAMVPDGLRGRVMSIYSITYSLMPLGGLQAGTIAGLFGAPFAVSLGGVIVSGFAVFVAVKFPHIRRL